MPPSVKNEFSFREFGEEIYRQISQLKEENAALRSELHDMELRLTRNISDNKLDIFDRINLNQEKSMHADANARVDMTALKVKLGLQATLISALVSLVGAVIAYAAKIFGNG